MRGLRNSIVLHIRHLYLTGYLLRIYQQPVDKYLLQAMELKYKILRQKAKVESSFIATNILDNAAFQIKNKLKGQEKN